MALVGNRDVILIHFLYVSLATGFSSLSKTTVQGCNGTRCPNDVCISNTSICNGINNCGDWSDELGCNNSSVTVCGMQQTQVSSFRIVDVEDSRPGDWPWVLLYGSYDRPFFICGASLISERWAITAAHCVVGFKTITAGITTSGDNSVFRESVDIAETIIHPEYDAVSNDNDIALLRLYPPLQFNLFVQPICYENLQYRPGTLCYAAGWGLSLEYGTNLQVRSVFLLSIEECRSLYPEYNVTDNMICAIYTSSRVLALFNEKGGPLMCESDDGTWNLVGVKSFEVGFMAGVYTKVSKYAEFIQQTISTSYSAHNEPTTWIAEFRMSDSPHIFICLS
ncbi:chymotrypsinogen 2-like [Anneissia japonica]|uniref:chymotrypsinogen 2-like n=1 Tax=Anneissia japonica TaxID=1529436 RepID=UPI00142584C9|nr:chymotrypsinogen 2-like [Anneissia japonica]